MDTIETTEAAQVKHDTYRIELGALAECPIWESHSRGKNWCASIAKDPRSPGGLARNFWEKAKGDWFYMLPSTLPSVGTILEFGADYYTGGGSKNPRRRYLVITECTEELLRAAVFKESSDAFTFAKSL